jgi:hypothetical protein
MKAVCHLMSTYKRDGQYPEIKDSIATQDLIANIGEFVQLGEKEYKIATIQNVLTKEDGWVRVYVLWEAMDYDMYLADCHEMQKQANKSNIITM